MATLYNLTKQKNMKKSKIILYSMLFISTISFAQVKTEKAKVLWGSENEGKRNSTLSDIVGYDETGVFAIKNAGIMGSTITLEHYDKKMNLTKSVELESKFNDKVVDFEFIIHSNKNLYLFTSFKNQKLKQNFIFVQTVDKKTLEPNNDMKKVAEISYAEKSKYNAGDFNYRISRDSSKVLVYFNLPYDKGESEKFGYNVFDKNINQIWEKQITLPYNEELFEVGDYQVDNNGNVYLLGKLFNDKRKSSVDGKPNYKQQLLSYSKNGIEFKDFPIEVDGKYLKDMKIAINEKGEIICAGFFSNVSKVYKSSIGGTFFLKVDGISKKIIVQNFKDFDESFFNEDKSDEPEKKDEKKKDEKDENLELRDYNLDDIIIKDDGGIVLIAEQFYSKTYGTTTTTNTTYYYYNSIIVVNMNAKGNIEWVKRIPKNQLATNDGGFFSSFVLAENKDKLYFIFNDNVRNLFLKEGDPIERTYLGKESVVSIVEIDEKGNMTREALFSKEDAGIITITKVCEQISKNEIIFYGQKGTKHKLGKLTFNE